MMSTMTGKLIKDRREKLGLLQKNVAKEIGVTAVFLARIESGNCELPPKRAEKVARILDLPLEQLAFALQHDMAESLKRKIKK